MQTKSLVPLFPVISVKRCCDAVSRIHGWLRVGTFFLTLILSAAVPSAFSAQGTDLSGNPHRKPALVTGQSATLLPDGRWLLVGGMKGGSVVATATILDSKTNKITPVANTLRQARAWHTATLLPDGSVVVFGGEGPHGAVISEAELFNPRTLTFDSLPDIGLIPRARHTATVLTDGLVLIAGGLSAQGQAISSSDLWNPRTRSTEPFKVDLVPARYGHSAVLLPNGSVLLSGGQSATGKKIANADVYQPSEHRFTPADKQTAADLPSQSKIAMVPAIRTSVPENGALGVPINSLVSVRFSKALRMQSLNEESVTLFGPTGTVPASIVPAEEGLLVFVTPQSPLQPATRYTLFVSGAADDAGALLPFSAMPFTTAALPAGSSTSVSQGASGSTPISETATPFTSASGLASVTTAAEAVSTTKTSNKPSAQAKAAIQNTNATADGEAWVPGQGNFSGNWRSNRPASPLQRLPALKGPPGVTALAGQLLVLDGKALVNATLSIGDKTIHSDATGRFLLTNLPAGHQVLVIDGSSADQPGKNYGVFEVGVEVVVGRTTALDYTIWMPLLDTAHAVSIPSPTTSEVVVTTPAIPGLELHVPPDTVIRDRTGQVVTQVGITAIPVDQPPFPLPPSVVPVYFTVQPGGAYLQGLNPQATGGARLIYPNFTHEAPGAKVNFWNYDPSEKGWYVYGQGTVSADGTKVVPDPGVALYEFTGAMISVGGLTPPATAPPPGNRRGLPGLNGPGGNGEGARPPCDGEGGGGNCGETATGGEPVDLATGLFVYDKTDLVVSDTLPLLLSRTYRTNDTAVRPFGIGANFPYGIFLWSAQQYQQADLVLPDGAKVHYVRISSGTGWTDAVFQTTSAPTAFYNSTIAWNGAGWDLKLKDGTVYVFGDNAPLQAIRDRYGNTVTLTRTSGQLGNISRVTSPNGRWINLSYDSSNRVTQAQDNAGRTITYTYDSSGRLWQVTDPAGGVTQYTYDSSHRLLTITDPRGIVYLSNAYDANGRVSQQTLADGGIYRFVYTLDANGKVTQTDVTDPRGNVRRVVFNGDGYPVSDTRALGKPEQQVFSYTRQVGSDLILSKTDPLGRVTAYTYDGAGNVASVTSLSGTANAVTTSYTYEPTYNQVTGITDPLSHAWGFAYDSRGSLVTATNPLNQQNTFTYYSDGHVATASDPLGNTTHFDYDQGDLAAITDPLGRMSTRFTDAIGRTISMITPLGNVNRTDYDSMSRATQVVDSAGGLTSFTYDANGNLSTVTDPRGGVTSYTYNAKDLVASRTDPLGKAESYLYDLNDNPTRFTDRKGQITNFTYDALNRRTFAGYGAKPKGSGYTYLSTVNFTLDSGNRLTQVVDSVSGTITLGYDGLDRLTQESGPQGNHSYAYDAASRRSSMTVVGQFPVTYGYDIANRLTSITQGTASVALTYDAASRRDTQTLPNGVIASYTYDVANQLTGISYALGGTSLGTLTYSYDADGHRANLGGSLARTGLPAAVSVATYNAGNRLTQWGNAALSYDANGSLTGDGTYSYSWDERNHLTSITSGHSTLASFQYDPFGRRTTRTVSGSTTAFLYDGLNPVQELTGSTPTANLLLGLGIDEFVTRTDAAGARHFLTDGLGSTLALTDSSGVVQTSYTYEPYGKATSSGASNTNPYQYTGRENDGIGLFYYRARYYHPGLQRFISEDPIGLVGGNNLYAYALGNPISYFDPLGLDIWIEGPSGPEPSFHQSVNVGNPNGGYSSYSYGMNGNGLQGQVYRDRDLGGPIESYKRTTPVQDAAFKKLMENQVGKTGIYGYNDICRSWSQRQFNNAPGVPSKPPFRDAAPQRSVSPSSSRSTTGTSSTTGTWTSR